MKKTNVMRILDSESIDYEVVEYDPKMEVDGEEIALACGLNPSEVFKTLVTEGKSGSHYVFLVPVENSLDLGKAARAVGEKSISLLHLKYLIDLTGYRRGGCSPIGMKKSFPVVIDSQAEKSGIIYINGGKKGYQVRIKLEDLVRVTDGIIEDIAKDE